MEFDIKAIFKRMYIACNVENDNQLSKYLNVKPSTVQGWRIAKTPPFKACFEIYQRTGFTVEWLVEGVHPHVKNSSTLLIERERVIELDEENFSRAFYEEVLSGIRLEFLTANELSTVENIQRLGKCLYKVLNNEPVIPKNKDKLAQEV